MVLQTLSRLAALAATLSLTAASVVADDALPRLPAGPHMG